MSLFRAESISIIFELINACSVGQPDGSDVTFAVKVFRSGHAEMFVCIFLNELICFEDHCAF